MLNRVVLDSASTNRTSAAALMAAVVIVRPSRENTANLLPFMLLIILPLSTSHK
jgi:hypothetical protein